LSTAHCLEAYVSFASGEPKKADEHVIEARSIGMRSKNEFTPFICLLTEAYFCLKQGKEPDALQALRKGLQIGKEKGFVNLFMCQKDVMEVILSKSLDAGIEVSYARDLIQRNAVMRMLPALKMKPGHGH
jgi:hypothetical protein